MSSDIVNSCSISVFKHKLKFVDFTPCGGGVHLGLCVSVFVIFFCWACISVFWDLCVQTCLNKWIGFEFVFGYYCV